MRLEIPEEVVRVLKRHAGRDYPRECCGFLVGRKRGGQNRVIIDQALPAENLNKERAHDRYEIDNRAFLDLQKSLRGTDQQVVGFYHSHPDHPCRPSETDLKRIWQGTIYLIIGVDGRGGGRKRYCLGAWSLEEHDLRLV